MRLSKSIKTHPDAGGKPQLTSLVDVLTVLLIFLIKSFSAEGSQVNPVSSIQLPFSVSHNNAQLMTSIEISKQKLQVNGKYIAETSSLQTSDSLYIPALYNELKLAKKSREVMIQADKSVEFQVIKKVMYTSSKAGLSDFTILVVNER